MKVVLLMIMNPALGGTFTFLNSNLTVNRMGYGAMQLAGPHVYGPPKDRPAALAVLREAVSLGINHIDTSDYYGPHVTNQIIKEALHPYPKNFTIVTKVGNRRAPDHSWPVALSDQELIDAVQDNLHHLGLRTLEIVNLRLGNATGTTEASLERPLRVLSVLKQKGFIKHIGLSNVTPKQFNQAENMEEIVCVQNHYNLAHRNDDQFLDELARKGVAYTPFFPLGGFTPLQSSVLDAVAREIQSSPMQVALAWLLHRSPNILLIPGTSSVEHLRQNVKAAELTFSSEHLKQLNSIGT